MRIKMKKLSKLLGLVLLAGIFAITNSGLLTPKKVAAENVDDLRAQVNSLQAQIDANNERVKELAAQADTLQNKVAEYDVQIDGVTIQIQLTTAKIAELQASLEKAQTELERQKGLLQTSIRALYKKGDASSFELLVGSQSFSQFVNEQEYLTRLKSGIQKSTDAVIALKQQIKEQQDEQTKLLGEQQDQKNALDAARAERQNLLDQTVGQEANYQAVVNSLKSQQIEINRKIFEQSNAQIFAGDPNKGGYPTYLANAGHDAIGDPWGMLNRECVSYAAWRVHDDFTLGKHSQDMPNFWPSYYYRYGYGHGGNAKDWIGDAQIDGIPYDRSPRVGDIMILASGDYGHAAYVEQVLDGNRVYISQYNWDWNGNYSEAIINYTQGDWYFIHFP